MGSLANYVDANYVMPEILAFSGVRILLVHGKENDLEFWWPPGSYWLAEKACDLTREQPEQWIARVVRAQIQLEPTSVRLRGVEHISSSHPPVLLYEVQLDGTPSPSIHYAFDAADYFPLDNLPSTLGRDRKHGEWLKSVLQKLPSVVG